MNKTTQTSEMENQKEEKKIVNGVSVTNLFQMVETIKNNSDIADFNFRAKGRWINGEYNITTINDFPQILVKPTTEVNHLDLKKMNHCTLRRRQRCQSSRIYTCNT